MILGPFWCEQKKAWLRFVTNGSDFKAQVAADSGWEDASGDFWIVDYEFGVETPIHRGFRLLDRNLYAIDIVLSAEDKQSRKSQYIVVGKSHISKINYTKGKVEIFSANHIELLKARNYRQDYVSLPKLPGQPNTNIPSLLEENPNKKSLEKKEAKEESSQDKWEIWKVRNVRQNLCNHIDLPLLQMNIDYITDFILNLEHLDPTKFSSFEVYEKALRDCITNKENNNYKAIYDFACRTDYHGDVAPNERKPLINSIFNCMRSLLNDELNDLLAYLNPTAQSIDLSATNITAEPSASSNITTSDENDVGMQQALLLSMAEQQAQIQSSPSPQVNQLVQAQENKAPNPKSNSSFRLNCLLAISGISSAAMLVTDILILCSLAHFPFGLALAGAGLVGFGLTTFFKYKTTKSTEESTSHTPARESK